MMDAQLVRCCWSAVVNCYRKCFKKGIVAARRQGHGRPRLTDACVACVVQSNRTLIESQVILNVWMLDYRWCFSALLVGLVNFRKQKIGRKNYH